MNVLFLTPTDEDYLCDSLLHGLKCISELNVVDYPKRDILYASYGGEAIGRLYGKGFTLYGMLPDPFVDRMNIIRRLQENYFDLVVLGNIGRQFGWYYQLLPWLNFRQTVALDSEDSPHVYPASGHWWRRPYYWLTPRVHNRCLYFKRELTHQSRFSILSRIVPRFLLNRIPHARRVRQIGFSIPESKVVTELPEKRKDFPSHIVDAEVRKHIQSSTESYAFNSEAEYYRDLQASRFGITMKRGGWECLRHYEIAANGSVPCFRNLHEKPKTSAPHGLNDANSVSYTDWTDLRQKIDRFSESDYRRLQIGAIDWARANTTVAAARKFLQVSAEYSRRASSNQCQYETSPR